MGVVLVVFFVCQHKAGPTTVEAVQALMTADVLFIFSGIMEREREQSTTAMLFIVHFRCSVIVIVV